MAEPLAQQKKGPGMVGMPAKVLGHKTKLFEQKDSWGYTYGMIWSLMLNFTNNWKLDIHRLEICQKIYMTKFSGERILHTEKV